MATFVSIDDHATDPGAGLPTTDRRDLVPVFEPTADGPAERLARRRGRRWIVPVVGAFFAAWAILSLLFVGIGLLLTKVVLADGRSAHDEAVNRWWAEHRTPALNDVTSVATFMANTWPVVLLFVTACVLWLGLRWWREAVYLAVALTLEVIVFLTINSIVHRDRPQVPRLDSTPATGSYPSGHVAATLVLWCGVALVISLHVRNRLVRAVAWVVAVAASALVGFARMYRGMHHLSDVIVGALLGATVLVVSIAVVRVVSAALDARRAARLDASRAEAVRGLALGDAAGDAP